MKIHRFIGGFDLREGDYIITDEDITHQIWDVLKLKPGERIVLCDGNMNEGIAVIGEKKSPGILVNIESVAVNTNEPDRHVTLYCAILKNENFELVCQKATEAGISELVPLITERTVKLNLRSERLGKIIREAAEQSGRGRVPALRPAMKLLDAIKNVARSTMRICFDVSGTEVSEITGHGIAVFIGPEGGWSEPELALFRGNDFSISSLGPRMLRAETAAIVAAWLASRS